MCLTKVTAVYDPPLEEERRLWGAFAKRWHDGKLEPPIFAVNGLRKHCLEEVPPCEAGEWYTVGNPHERLRAEHYGLRISFYSAGFHRSPDRACLEALMVALGWDGLVYLPVRVRQIVAEGIQAFAGIECPVVVAQEMMIEPAGGQRGASMTEGADRG